MVDDVGEVIVDDDGWGDEQREQVGFGFDWVVWWRRGSLWWSVEEQRVGEESESVAVVANECRCRLSARHHRRDPGSDRTPMPLVP